MNTLFEQSIEYARLGMLEEARALADQSSDPNAPVLRARLAYKSGDYARTIAIGRKLMNLAVPEDFNREYLALSLLHLGRAEEAAALMLEVGASNLTPRLSYQTACFLTAAGKCEDAMPHLLRSLPSESDTKAKTWLDGDLARLWTWLSIGEFSLNTAHILIEKDFDLLREWEPTPGTEWELDPRNYADLPPELQAVVRLDAMSESYVLDYAKAPAYSRLADLFERWSRCAVSLHQSMFDEARLIARAQVLDAQPGYAQAAWELGDLCAARNHILWALEVDPARIEDFAGLTDLKPLIDEYRRMIEADRDIFAKSERAHELRYHEPEAALEILDALPAEWYAHPMLQIIRASSEVSLGMFQQGMERLRQVCARNPDDAAPFLRAMMIAQEHDWRELAAEFYRAAPAAAHRYAVYVKLAAYLNGTPPPDLPPTRGNRGQPDLGGHIVSVEKSSPQPLPNKTPA